MEADRRVLLVEPPFYRLLKPTYSLERYPLSLGYLAGTIRRDTDWKVTAYNADFTPESEALKLRYQMGPGYESYLRQLRAPSGPAWDELRETLKSVRPHVVGISAKSQNFASARIVARMAKEADPGTLVIVGGPHPSMAGPDVLKFPEFDLAAYGEGEQTIVELLRAVESGGDFSNVAGIFRRDAGKPVGNPPRAPIEDLDSLVFPHESAPEVLKDYAKYPPAAFQYVFATRGCPYRCSFCGSHQIWSRRVRFRSPENVVREIQSLRKLGLGAIHFDDDTFGVSRDYLLKLCRAIAEGCPGLRWSCEMHVKLAEDDLLAAMKSAGCTMVLLGVESGNNDILRAVNKGITIEEALAAAGRIRKHGIELRAFFMVGFPEETEATLGDTIDAMKRIDADTIAYSVFTPYPGTEAYEYCREHGLIGDDFDPSLYHHQCPANSFTVNIPRERFREIVSKAERWVDRRNWRKRMRRAFSPAGWRRMKDLGFRTALRKALRLLGGK